MLIKVKTEIIVDVKNDDQAEAACSSLDAGLDAMLQRSGFPDGDIVAAEVDSYEPVSDNEANERGWVE